jgi:pimeloyl-ACP methyl ester carboxylesterase
MFTTSDVLEPRRPRLKYVLLGTMAGIYMLVVALMVVFQGKLVFPGPANFPMTTPDVADMAFEDVHIPVDGKTAVHAWWIPSSNPDAKVIVYFHGNAEVIQQELNVEARVFHATGSSVLLVEYRGYGDGGKFQTSGTTTAEDARLAMRYLEQQRHIPVSKIVICGWSVGSGVAAQLALESPDAGGLVLLSAITSVEDVANQDWMYRYPLRPIEWFRHDNDFDTKDKMAAIHIPVLIISGTDDTLAPPWMAKELFERANGPKKLQMIEGAGHTDLMEPRDGTLEQELQSFLVAPGGG